MSRRKLLSSITWTANCPYSIPITSSGLWQPHGYVDHDGQGGTQPRLFFCSTYCLSALQSLVFIRQLQSGTLKSIHRKVTLEARDFSE